MNIKKGFVSIRSELKEVTLEEGKNIFHGHHYYGIPGNSDIIHEDHVFQIEEAKKSAAAYKETKPATPLAWEKLRIAENAKLQGHSKAEIQGMINGIDNSYLAFQERVVKDIETKKPGISKSKALEIAAIAFKYGDILRDHTGGFLLTFNQQLIEDIGV